MTRFVGTPLRGIEFGAPSDEGISLKVAGDTVARLRIDAGGRLTWSSGDATGDVLLYRDSAGVLLTDDVFEATGGLVTLVSEGVPTEALADGALAVDATNFVFYFRADGTWHPIVGSTTLDDLTDVTISSPESGQFLQYDGTEWVNSTFPTNEPTGFPVKSDSAISFDEETRIFTIAPSSTVFDVWCSGIKHTISSPQTVTIPNTSGLYYIYFDSTGALEYKTTYFEFSVEAPVSYIYWNAEDGVAYFFADERHGVTLDWQTHEYLHRTRGAAIAGGFGVNEYTIVGDGELDSDAQISIANGTFFDEDMEIYISHSATPAINTWEQRLQNGAYIPVFYHQNSHWVKDVATQFPMKQGTSRVQYNLNTAGVWSSVDIAQNKFGISWIVATNNLNEPIIAILGQNSYNTQGEADAIGWDSLNLDGFPVFEFRPLYKITYETASGYSNTPNARITGVYDLRRIISGADHAIPTTPVTDHGSMTGLGDDDHTQYFNSTRHDAHDHSTAMSTVDTDDIAEGSTNLYFSDSLARGAVNADLGGVDGGTRFIAPTANSDVQLISHEATHAVIVQSNGITDAKVVIKGSAEIIPSTSIADPGNLTVAGSVTVNGDLTVNGTTTTLNTDQLSVEDNIITLNSGVTGSPSLNAGIQVERGTSTNVELRWNETTDRWQFTNDGTTYTDLGGVKLSATEPTGIDGELWFNTDTQSLYVYDGEWIAISGGGGGGASVLVQETAPGFGSTGDLWYSSSLGKFFIRYDSYWVEIMSAGPQGPQGEQGIQGIQGLKGDKGDTGDLSTSILDDLSDVVITTVSTDDYLRWDGNSWVNHNISLGTHTVGDYVDSLVAGTGVTILNNGGEGSTPTVRIGQAVGTTSNVTFGSLTTTGNVTVGGDLVVNGETVTLNTTVLNIEDNIITLNSGVSGAPITDAGIEVNRGTSPDTKIIWNETTDKWQFTNDGTIYTNLGAGGAVLSEAPPSPVDAGTIWFKTSTAQTFVYYDSFWIEIGIAGTGATVGTASPSSAVPNPVLGQIYFNKITLQLFAYNGVAWVTAAAPTLNPTFTGNVTMPATTSIGTVTSAEIGYLQGVTSQIQTQLNNKQPLVANISSTELGYLDGVTSSVQTQLNSKIGLAVIDANGDLIIGASNDSVTRLAVGSTSQVLTANSSAPNKVEWAPIPFDSDQAVIASQIFA